MRANRSDFGAPSYETLLCRQCVTDVPGTYIELGDDAFGAPDSFFRQPSEHASTFPRRGWRPSCAETFALKRGRGECRVPSAPAASCAHGSGKCTRVFTASSPESPGIPARNGFNVSFALSPVTGLSCHRRLRSCLRQLDASVGASGPHDFSVRLARRSSCVAKASIASRTNVRDDAYAPLVGRDGGINNAASSKSRSEIFFEMGLDTKSRRQPVGQITACDVAR